MIVAGEASGDMYGASLVEAIKRLAPRANFFGLGGPEMQRAGVRTVRHLSDIAVVGMTEVIPKMRRILGALRMLKGILSSDPPDLLILIDYPGFNLNLAKKAHALGIPVLYYIPPQLWAWWEARVKKVAHRADQVAVVLPFEKDFYLKHGIEVAYVGHPLLDMGLPKRSKEEIRESLGISSEKGPVLGLLPGSRNEEVLRHLPIMINAAELISDSYPHLYCVLPLASTVNGKVIEPYVRNAGCDIVVDSSDTKELLKIADVAFVASGTATLEAAITKTPMVIAYKVSPVSYMLGRLLAKVSHIGLVNLVAGKTVVRELIQGEATAAALAEEGLAILKNDEVREHMKEELRMVTERLGQGGASEKTARIAGKMMGIH